MSFNNVYHFPSDWHVIYLSSLPDCESAFYFCALYASDSQVDCGWFVGVSSENCNLFSPEENTDYTILSF